MEGQKQKESDIGRSALIKSGGSLRMISNISSLNPFCPLVPLLTQSHLLYLFQIMGLFHINTHKLADVCADDKNYNNILAMQITLMRLFLYLHLHDYLLTLVLQRVHSQPQLHIARTTLTSPSPSTLTIPFAHPFSRTPGFAYTMESMSLQQTQAAVQYTLINVALSACTVQFRFNGALGWGVADFVDLVMLWVLDEAVETGIVEIGGTAGVVPYLVEHRYNFRTSYSLTVFTATLPLVWTITSSNNYNFQITLTAYPSNPSIKKIIMYLLVQKVFLANSIFVVFDRITEYSRHYILRRSIINYLNPSNENTFQGLMQIRHTSSSLSLPRLMVYEFMQPYATRASIKVGFMATVSTITKLQAAYINFNPGYLECPQQSYLSYGVPFSTVPLACKPCHFTCQTCTSSEEDSVYTDYRFCTDCPEERYLEMQGNYPFGTCNCLKGLEIDSEGNCLQCQYNCLTFRVDSMKSAMQAVFILIFTHANITVQGTFDENLMVYVDQVEVLYNFTNFSPGAYKINLNSSSITPCQQSCQVKFKFSHPQQVTADSLYLTKQSYTLYLQDFYIVEDRLPEQLNQALLVSSLLIAASSSSGQAAMIKMLFELEQVIEVHKYVNMELPVVFKEFIEALSMFRFMDITTVLQYDVNSRLRELSGADLDSKGNYKIVYYENGANFYKNIVAVLFSTLIVMVVNLLIWGLFRILPCSLTKSLAEKIKIRWVITLSEMLETLVIPISLFFVFQIAYTVPTTIYIWVYALGYLLFLFILTFPFITLSFLVIQRQKMSQVQLQIIQDLLQDCRIGNKISYVFYVYGYIKKFIFGIVLASQLSGLVQIFLLIMINMIHLLMIIYIIVYKVYKSRIKLLTRTINLLCVTVLQGLILGYNLTYSTIENKILLGVTCTYLTLIATGVGLLEIVIKIVEVVSQKIKENRTSKPEGAQHEFVRNRDGGVLKCGIAGGQRTVFNIDEDSEGNGDEEKKEVEYEEIVPIGSLDTLEPRQQNRGKGKARVKSISNEDQEWSKFSESNNNKRTIQVESESSQIVAIEDNDNKVDFKERDRSNGLYMRSQHKKQRLKQKYSFEQERKRTASTKGQLKRISQPQQQIPPQNIPNTLTISTRNNAPKNKIKQTLQRKQKNNKILRVNDKKHKYSIDFDNDSSMSQIADIKQK